MMDNNRSLIAIKYTGKELEYDEPQGGVDLYKGTISAIRNAWENGSIVDNRGQIWINSSKLHSILRTKTYIVKYRIEKIRDEDKMFLNNELYIRGYIIHSIIDEFIQKSTIGRKNKYLRLSEAYYFSIRDCEKRKLVSIEYEHYLEDVRKKLKRSRIRKYNLKIDELTKKVLDKKTCEFSHIRSYEVYKELGDNIENGLIVNKETHSIITKNNVINEDELLNLAIKRKWNLSWYEEYKRFLEKI